MTRRRIHCIDAPMLSLRRYHEIGLRSPAVPIAGLFGWELIHAGSGVAVRSSPPRSNLLLNQGIDALYDGTFSLALFTCAVGTGNTPPEPTDTSLENEIGRTSANGGFDDQHGTGTLNGRPYAFFRRTRVFTESEANGVLTEVAMVRSGIGDVFTSRQLLRDAQGEPTEVVKTDEYQLRVIYEIRLYEPEDPSDVVVDAQINGITTPVNVRMFGQGANQWGGKGNSAHWVNLMTAMGTSSSGFHVGPSLYAGSQPAASANAPSGIPNNLLNNGLDHHAYTPGTFVREMTSTWSPAIGNSQAYTGLVVGVGHAAWGAFSFHWGSNNPLDKTANYRFVVEHAKSFTRGPVV